MSKRHLTERQTVRIKNNQRKQDLKRISPASCAEYESNTGRQSGVVLVHYKYKVDVRSDGNGQIYRCHLRQNLGTLVTGDQVFWQDCGPNKGVVLAVEPRRSTLSRPDRMGKLKPFAANIDQLVVVIATAPAFSEKIVDRYLVTAELAKIQAIILLNKIDLIGQSVKKKIDQRLDIYRRINYSVLEYSALTHDGRAVFTELLANKTTILVGQSGVGKSSIVNSLAPEQGIRVGALSQTSGLGKHTTTTSRLFKLDNNGKIIDSPGIRRFACWHSKQQSLIDGFVELSPYQGQCKFRDCSHHNDPGCALREALNKGAISSLRLESYRQLQAQSS